MEHLHDAHGAGQNTPECDEAPAGDTPQGFRDQESSESPDCHGARHAGQVLRVIEGEQQAEPDELAVIVSMLNGPGRRRFCPVIEKVSRVPSHG